MIIFVLARDSADEGTDDDNKKSSTGRQGPRSPLRSRRTRQRGTSFDETDELDNEPEEDPQQKEQLKPETEEEEDYIELFKIEHPVYAFPLRMLPQSRAQENITQPLLVIPASHPDILGRCDGCLESCGPCLTCCASFLDPKNLSHQHDELEILRSSNPEFGWLLAEGNEDSPDQSSDQDRLLPTQIPHEWNLESDLDLDSGSEVTKKLMSRIRRLEGLYIDGGPVLTDMLLCTEALSTAVGDAKVSEINLARTTQRIVRELLNSLGREKLRQQWQQMYTPQGPRTRRSQTPKDAHVHFNPKPKRGLSETNLLKKVGRSVAFKILENPVVDTLAQPVLPETSIAYGGELGQWGNDASPKERLGTIIATNVFKKPNRSILRVHVHALSVANHPLLVDEEREFVGLRRAYSQYSAVFEQRTTGYLSYRLAALLMDLTRLSNSPEPQPEDLLVMRRLYHDLIETLPCLCELRAVIDALGKSIFDSWTKLQDTRRRVQVAIFLFLLFVFLSGIMRYFDTGLLLFNIILLLLLPSFNLPISPELLVHTLLTVKSDVISLHIVTI